MNLSIITTIKTRYIVYVATALLGASFLGYFYNQVNNAGFIFFGLLTLILGLWRREYAIYLLFLELTLGSFGYLLSWEADGLHLPLRILLFIVVMGLWFYDVIKLKVKSQKLKVKESSHYKLLSSQNKIVLSLALFLFIWILGIIEGYLRGNLPSNIFFDANSYLYLLLILPTTKYICDKEKLDELIMVVLTGSLLLALGTFALFITFINVKNLYVLEIIYKWVRDFRIGEITSLETGAYRIFIQSQFYFLISFLLIMVFYFYKKIKFSKFLFYGIILSGGIYISLSRSFWVGLVFGIFIYILLLLYVKNNFKKVVQHIIWIAGIFFAGVLFVSLFIPKDASLLGDRLKIGESALNSRVSQLEPLLPAIKTSPIIGYGFGKTLTFKSFDPRVAYVLKNGKYTTYAFEWGYLDIILKIGIVGLIVYLYFIWTIVFALIKKLKSAPVYSILAIASLAVLLATHMFTPYLNHPLGIGVLILGAVIANIKE